MSCIHSPIINICVYINKINKINICVWNTSIYFHIYQTVGKPLLLLLNVNYYWEVNNRNTRAMYEISSKLVKRHQNDLTGIFLVYLLLNLKRFPTSLWRFHC